MSGSLPIYYTPHEVSQHNVEDDLWVSFLGKVVNLTALAQAHKGNVLMRPIISAAGTDISHWFDERTKNVSLGSPRGLLVGG